jgi:hypothetical protein
VNLKVIQGGYTEPPQKPPEERTLGDVSATPEWRDWSEKTIEKLTPAQQLRRRGREARLAERQALPDDVRIAAAAKKRKWTEGEIAFAIVAVQKHPIQISPVDGTFYGDREKILSGKSDPWYPHPDPDDDADPGEEGFGRVEHPDTFARHKAEAAVAHEKYMRWIEDWTGAARDHLEKPETEQ